MQQNSRIVDLEHQLVAVAMEVGLGFAPIACERDMQISDELEGSGA
ncbi:MAG: hypothetical protein JWN61_1410, partial [Pseudonocardiales bacterium]|nr:hypothetical protein [Pseudonocardiales bacterium]